MIKIFLFIDVITLIILYFLWFLPKYKDNSYRLVILTLLYIYLSFVAYFTELLPVIMPIPFINISISNMNFDSLLFRSIISGYGGAILEVILNIIMFIPLGILLPLAYNYRFKRVMISGILLSSFIEFLQFIAVRNINVSELTDILTNTLGCLIGYLCYKLLIKDSILLKHFKNFCSKFSLSFNYSKVINKMLKWFFIIVILQLFIRSFILSIY